MSETHQLICAIIQFLKAQIADAGLSEDRAEGVAIGIQCIEAAYNISPSENSFERSLDLQEIFQNYITERERQDAVSEDKALALKFKNEGNSHMDLQNFNEAIASYTLAIQLEPKNAVYYCNRAAAFNNLRSFDNAIQDCKSALKFNPSYHKAYARMGSAYTGKVQHKEAVDSYRKALELAPNDEKYKSNLKSAEDALASSRCTININCNGLSTSFTLPNLGNSTNLHEQEFADIIRLVTQMAATPTQNIN